MSLARQFSNIGSGHDLAPRLRRRKFDDLMDTIDINSDDYIPDDSESSLLSQDSFDEDCQDLAQDLLALPPPLQPSLQEPSHDSEIAEDAADLLEVLGVLPHTNFLNSVDENVEIRAQQRCHSSQSQALFLSQGWRPVDFAKETFVSQTISRFVKVIFNKESGRLEIFLKQCSQEFLVSLFSSRLDLSWTPSLFQIFIYVAVRIRVQGFQEKPKPSDPKVNPQRRSFEEALQHFSQNKNFVIKITTNILVVPMSRMYHS